MITRISQLALFIMLGALAAQGALPYNVRFHDEKQDTTRITEILIDATNSGATGGELVTRIARLFLDRSYVGGKLEGEEEVLTVNLDELDCTTFVETVAALAMTVNRRRTSWRDFLDALESVRYRGGQIDGYASRLHYASDWITDNSHRGNVVEATQLVGNPAYQVKTIDYMSTHRDRYPALSDEPTYQAIKNVEIGYWSHRFPYIRKADAKKVELREGDIVMLVTTVKGLDVSHMGIITLVDGKPHLLHASSTAKKVVVDSATFDEYMRRNPKCIGFRVIRLKD